MPWGSVRGPLDPPRVAEWIVSVLEVPECREDTLGGMRSDYCEDLFRRGMDWTQADRRYRRAVRADVPRLVRDRACSIARTAAAVYLSVVVGFEVMLLAIGTLGIAASFALAKGLVPGELLRFGHAFDVLTIVALAAGSFSSGLAPYVLSYAPLRAQRVATLTLTAIAAMVVASVATSHRTPWDLAAALAVVVNAPLGVAAGWYARRRRWEPFVHRPAAGVDD